MNQPVRRLFIIAAITLLWLVLAVVGLRKIGMSDQFQALDHPLINDSYWLIAWGGDSSYYKPMTAKAFDAAAELDSRIILGAAVQSLRQGELVLAERHYAYDGKNVEFLRRMTMEDWRRINPGGMTLENFIQKYSNRRIYLNLDRLNILNNAQLYKTLEPIQDKKQILIKSSPQGIKKSLKEKQPWWLFSNTTSEIGKLKLMQAIFLEPVVSLNADFFVDKKFSPRILHELRRRHKKAILAPLPDEEGLLTKAKSFDGLVTTRPSDFISLVD